MRARLFLVMASLAMLAAPALSQSVVVPHAARAQNANAPARAASRGELIAIAADCAGCHLHPGSGSEFAGGLPINSPMGTIYARNITPDPETGIGRWTLADFDAAVRQGKSKELGHLYPAMPYTSYRYMTDDDLKALFEYLMKDVRPVKNVAPETNLGFPYLRPAMIVWNTLFAGSGAPPGLENASEQQRRGQYLVDVLGHCGECHTPRGILFQTKASSAHLGGGTVGGWEAPNISSDKTGIGDWSTQQIKTFFTHGKANSAIAGGDMSLVARLSLSKLPDSDLDAMAAYLQATAAVVSQPRAPIVQSVAKISLTEAEPVNGGFKDFADTSTTNGAVLYLSACATCHGADGSLSNGAGPSLTQSRAVRAANPINVVQTIASGINLGAMDKTRLMPAFRSDLSAAQIAAIATYVRQRFGGSSGIVTEAEATSIIDGTVGTPWLMLNARWLAWLGVAAGILVVAWGLIRLRGRSHKRQLA